MYLFGLEIRKDKRVNDITAVTCFRCAKDFIISRQHLRAYNYCPSCK